MLADGAVGTPLRFMFEYDVAGPGTTTVTAPDGSGEPFTVNLPREVIEKVFASKA
jgi:hypothetical protein